MAQTAAERRDVLETDLERLVDQHTMKEVLDVLETVCHLKAEHLRSNWQDDSTAREYERIGRRLGSLVGTLDKTI